MASVRAISRRSGSVSASCMTRRAAPARGDSSPPPRARRTFPSNRPGGIGRQPIGLPGLPGDRMRLSLLGDDLQRSALERDDRPPVVVAMQRQRLIGHDDRLPDPHFAVLELRLAPRARRLLLQRVHRGGRGAERGRGQHALPGTGHWRISSTSRECGRRCRQVSHDDRPRRGPGRGSSSASWECSQSDEGSRCRRGCDRRRRS